MGPDERGTKPDEARRGKLDGNSSKLRSARRSRLARRSGFDRNVCGGGSGGVGNSLWGRKRHKATAAN